jgi:hypothetical protein
VAIRNEFDLPRSYETRLRRKRAYDRHTEQAINIRTPQDAFCQMATNVATARDIELGDDARAQALRPVTWDEWLTLPIRPQDNAVQTVRGPIRVPTVIVAVNFAKVSVKPCGWENSGRLAGLNKAFRARMHDPSALLILKLELAAYPAGTDE